MVIRRSFAAPLLLLTALLIASGCNRGPGIDETDTIVSSGPVNRADWVDTTASTFGAGAAGLDPRGADGSLADSIARGDVFEAIYFEFDQSGIAAAERPKANRVAEQMFNSPGVRIFVEGHCDWRGTAEYNLALGDRRAQSVKRYLQGLGIDPARVETSSRGDLEAQEGVGEDQMARDRRADVILVR